MQYGMGIHESSEKSRKELSGLREIEECFEDEGMIAANNLVTESTCPNLSPKMNDKPDINGRVQTLMDELCGMEEEPRFSMVS